MFKIKMIAGAMVVSLMAVAAAGCGSKGKEPETAPTPVINNDPAIVRLAGQLTNEDFTVFAKSVQKKYPHITIERINTAEKGQSVPELVAAGIIPDLILAPPLNILPFQALGLYYKVEELVTRHRFDLNRIKPEYLESIKVGSFSDYLVGLPIYNNGFGLFYNKDLFDRFGVPYPKDGMTWQEVTEMAVKLTRVENGVAYYGLHPNSVMWGAYQLGLPFIDTANNKSMFQSQGWKDLFQMWQRLYTAGGNIVPKALAAIKGFQDGQIAMTMGYSSILDATAKVKDLNWDMVTYPINPDAPGIGQRVDSINLVVTAQSKVKDAAFQVIEVILSEEVQTELSRSGKVSVLKDQKVHDQFGQSNADLQKKNVVALTKPKLAIVQPFKFPFATNPATLINNTFNSVIYDQKDINTALREAEEKVNTDIQLLLK
ncbi:ABC transporter substrate-binding protein [Paenibacillus hodogayensis]|uniref:ABC transporter substrate-binding protein n=1 Tax=Paenibacillus hodogayensis TaxID=279208 RepID=A0ABV5W6Z7_9BACL